MSGIMPDAEPTEMKMKKENTYVSSFKGLRIQKESIVQIFMSILSQQKFGVL